MANPGFVGCDESSESRNSSFTDTSMNSLNRNVTSIISFLASPQDSSATEKDDLLPTQPVSILKGNHEIQCGNKY